MAFLYYNDLTKQIWKKLMCVKSYYLIWSTLQRTLTRHDVVYANETTGENTSGEKSRKETKDVAQKTLQK